MPINLISEIIFRLWAIHHSKRIKILSHFRSNHALNTFHKEISKIFNGKNFIFTHVWLMIIEEHNFVAFLNFFSNNKKSFKFWVDRKKFNSQLEHSEKHTQSASSVELAKAFTFYWRQSFMPKIVIRYLLASDKLKLFFSLSNTKYRNSSQKTTLRRAMGICINENDFFTRNAHGLRNWGSDKKWKK